MEYKAQKYQYYSDYNLVLNSKEYIFVFGSNLAGIHGAGAALVARQKFGAKLGVGVGLSGRSYAIPTKDKYLKTLDLEVIKHYVDMFKSFTYSAKEYKFWVTRVGCGLAGYKDYQIAPLFKNCNTNCIFYKDWSIYLQSNI